MSSWFRALVVSVVTIGAAALPACGDPKVVIIAPSDLPSTVPEGQTLVLRFEAKPTLDGGAFLRCGPETNEKINVAVDGTLTYQARTARTEVELCIAYRKRSGGTVAKHVFKLTVGPRARATDEDFRAPVATHRKRVRALVKASKAAKVEAGKVEACGKLAVPVEEPMPYTIYDSKWVDDALDLVAPNLKGPVLLGPEEVLRYVLTEAERQSSDFETKHLGQVHALVVVPDKQVMPKLIVPKQFAVGKPTFRAGTFEGTLHIGRLDSGKVVCSMPLSFRSSETLNWTDWVKQGEARDPSLGRLRFKLRNDFARNGVAAVREAVAALGK